MAAQNLRSNILHRKGTVDNISTVLPECEHGVMRPCEKLSKNDYSKVFRELDITDYREVEPYSFKDYLSCVDFGEAILQCKNSAGNICSDNTATTLVNEPIPKKKTKRDEDDPEEVKDDGSCKVIFLDLLTKCVTHPRVVKLVCDLLTEQLLTPLSE